MRIGLLPDVATAAHGEQQVLGKGVDHRNTDAVQSTGMPRPLSLTLMDSSGWMVMVMSLQCPASASSIELSTTSNTMWCRPLPSSVSPMYIPGRLRTASNPFKTLILDEV